MASHDEAIVLARGVSKKFCRNLRRSLAYAVSDSFGELTGFRWTATDELRQGEFWANQDVSFELARGESLGLIGNNGAGKSTLLKLLSGLMRPDAGDIWVRGRVGALIALGAGFNPVLTGRENVYINAAILGFRKAEVDRLLDGIIDFAELSEFIDSPVQSYSSGMQIRLGFAVAVNLSPDLMLVDEVLAVGDAGFQRKCFDRIYEMQAKGTSFIVVSHSPYQLERLCDRVAVMARGRIAAIHSAKDAVAAYHQLEGVALEARGAAKGEPDSREGTGALRFDQVSVGADAAAGGPELRSLGPMAISLSFVAREPVRDVRFRIEICSGSNVVLANVTTIGLSEERTFAGAHRVTFSVPRCLLTTGVYHVNAFAVDRNVRLDVWRHACEFKVVLNDLAALALSSNHGVFVAEGTWQLE